jgi:hypothetical protein
MSKKLKILIAVVSLLGVIGTVWVSMHYHSNNELTVSSDNKEPIVSSMDVLFRRDISGMTIEVEYIPDDVKSKLGLNVNAIPKFNVPKRRQESLIQELQLGKPINNNKEWAGGSGWGIVTTIDIQYENGDAVNIPLGYTGYDGGTIYQFYLERKTDTRYDYIFDFFEPEFKGRSIVELMKLIVDAWQASTNPGETGQ